MRTKKAFFVLLSRSLKSAVHLFAWVTAPAPSLATCSSFGISSDCSRPVTEWLLEVSRLILLHVMLPPGTNVLCLTLPLAQETGYKHLTIIIRVQANPNSCFPAWEARWIVVLFFFFFCESCSPDHHSECMLWDGKDTIQLQYCFPDPANIFSS